MTSQPEPCACAHKPACEPHRHTPAAGTCFMHGHIVLTLTQADGITGPPCIWDNAPTQRAGSCYVCPLCGNSTSC